RRREGSTTRPVSHPIHRQTHRPWPSAAAPDTPTTHMARIRAGFPHESPARVEGRDPVPQPGDMTAKYNWKSVAKTAKKWVDAKNIETPTDARQTRLRADAAGHPHGRELTEQASGAALATQIPGHGRAIEHQEANRLGSQHATRDVDYAR